LVLFPEALVGGYPRGATFGAVVGDRSPAGREEFLAYSAQAVTIPGPEVDQLCEVAAANGAHLVVGVVERTGTTLYCGSVTIDDTGRLVGRRRKVMPTGSERLVWGQGDGSTLEVPRTALGQLATMRHIAVEGRCFVLAANQVARAGDLSPAYATAYPDPDQVVCRGASVIVDPFGTVLAGPLLDEEGLLVADLDLDEVTRGRYDFDVTGHYSRPDLFSLTVDTRHRSAVTTLNTGPHNPDLDGMET
jgi:nitrilase